MRSSDNLGNEVVSQGDLTFFTAPLPAPSIVVSDDMNDQSLQPIWNFVNPFPPGGSSVQNNGATTHIVVPGGAAHEIWTGGYLAPRIMQTANNTDLEITVRFLSGLSGTSSSSQSQGLVFESDPNNCLRFDFTTGLDDSTRIFAAGFANGFSSPAVKVSRNISAYNQSPLYLKVRRESNVWTELYSFDGVTWNNGATFYYALPVNKVGVFAGNGGSAPQQFDCLIDEVAAPLPATARLVTPSPNAADVPLPPALTWESLQSTSYQVQLSQDSTFVGTVVYDSVVTVPTAQPSSLAGLTRYFWRARGKNANGNGSYSGVQSFTTAVLVPPAPLLAAPGNGALGQPLQPTLRWFNANGASSYWLQVSTDSLFSALVFSDSAIVDSFGVPASLSYETEYYWRVRAKNINGAGPFSEKRTFTTSIGPVVLWSPSNHTADADTTGLLFTWRRMTSATSYRFELATDSTFATGLIKDVSGIVDTFRVVSGLASNRQHYWRVRGANGGGSGPASPVWDFSTLAPLGVREAGVLPHAYQLYQNYPNPFNPTTEITFDIAAASAVEITIHDLLGRIVRRLVSEQKAPGQYRVTWEGTDDTGAGVASGVYLYRIQAGSFVQTRKLILLR